VAEPAITSRQNPLVARFRAAAEGDAHWMLLDGPHLVDEALAANLAIDVAAFDPGHDAGAHHGLPARLGSRAIAVSARVLDAMSPVRTPSGIVALAARPAPSTKDVWRGSRPLVVGAVDIQDPGNLGAIVRAAEAGGATAVVTTPGSADPFGWKALRGAMGSAFRLPIARAESIAALVADAKRHGLRVVASVGHGGTALTDAPLTGPALLLVGSEGQGLPADAIAAADDRVSVPMAPPVESLNVAVAAALLVYEARRQRQALSTTTKVTKDDTKSTKSS
jgi:TrmH family RNA methyltransferase